MDKKVFRKILIVSIFALLLSFFLVGGNNIKATESDNMKASYMVVETKKTVRYTYTNYKVEDALTTINSTASKQTVCVFTQKQTENSKVVTWAVNKGTGFSFKTIPQIAEDYEKNHPDWFVVGGINADQYIMSQGTGGVSNGTDFLAPQPYYPMIADGESWFSVPCWPSSGGGNAAAFLQDGSTDCIVNGSMNLKSGNIKIKGLFLAVLDENGVVVKKARFEGAYTFIYSPREGTPAATYENTLTPDEKKARLLKLNDLINEGFYEGNKRFEGEVVNVLVDGTSDKDPNMLTGYTPHEKVVNFPGSKDLIGKFVDVKIKKAYSWHLRGEIVENN